MSDATKNDPRIAARQIAHHGVNGAIEVAVPELSDGFAGLGGTSFVDELDDLASGFDQADRVRLIEQLILTMRSFYVHRSLKWAKHAVDPVQSLERLLRTSRNEETNATLSDLEFHSEVSRIFKSLRDIHTAYVLPEPYRSRIAFLPITLGYYRDASDGPPRILVTRLLQSLGDQALRKGSEILTWNGRPIEKAVRAVGVEESGSNPFAQFALGLRLMTIRWLGGSLPPEANWVTLGYLDPVDRANPDAHREYREIRLSWRVLKLEGDSDDAIGIPLVAAMLLEEKGREVKAGEHKSTASDMRGIIENAFRHEVFKSELSDIRASSDYGEESSDWISEPIDTEMSDVFEPRTFGAKVRDENVTFGYLRIHNFQVDYPSDFRREFVRLTGILPRNGLVIDLRSNAGGNPFAAEIVMQCLTPREIDPLPFQFATSREVEAWVEANSENPEIFPTLEGWPTLVSPAVENGFAFSRRAPLTSRAKRDANRFGQSYYGAVVLLIDGITYSSGDIFAALFKDHDVGVVIGTNRATGGGGAEMWSHADFCRPDSNNAGLPFEPLPHGAGMHLAFRSYLRVGQDHGLPVEELGVEADHFRPPTFDDVMHNDRDLLREAARCLVDNRRPAFRVRSSKGANEIELEVETDPEAVLEVDVFVGESLFKSSETRDGELRLLVPKDRNSKSRMHLRIEAFEALTTASGRKRRRLTATWKRTIWP